MNVLVTRGITTEIMDPDMQIFKASVYMSGQEIDCTSALCLFTKFYKFVKKRNLGREILMARRQRTRYSTNRFLKHVTG